MWLNKAGLVVANFASCTWIQLYSKLDSKVIKYYRYFITSILSIHLSSEVDILIGF